MQQRLCLHYLLVPLFGITLTKNKILGVLVGFIGAIMIILSKIEGIDKNSINVFILLPFMATICYGINANLFKFFQNENPLHIALLQYSAVAVIALPYLVFIILYIKYN